MILPTILFTDGTDKRILFPFYVCWLDSVFSRCFWKREWGLRRTRMLAARRFCLKTQFFFIPSLYYISFLHLVNLNGLRCLRMTLDMGTWQNRCLKAWLKCATFESTSPRKVPILWGQEPIVLRRWDIGGDSIHVHDLVIASWCLG